MQQSRNGKKYSVSGDDKKMRKNAAEFTLTAF